MNTYILTYNKIVAILLLTLLPRIDTTVPVVRSTIYMADVQSFLNKVLENENLFELDDNNDRNGELMILGFRPWPKTDPWMR